MQLSQTLEDRVLSWVRTLKTNKGYECMRPDTNWGHYGLTFQKDKKKKNKIHTEPNDAALILYVQHLMQHDIIINYA